MTPLALLVTALLACSPQTSRSAGAEEDVRFHGGGVTLAGTLLLPPGAGPHPALAFTHGSEPANRNHPSYRASVRPFVDAGIAVLIYDKRGVGDSEGTYVEAPDLRQPCADLLGAIAFLREHARIDRGSLGVWGASQGGWVAPMAASLSDDIRYVCVVAAPGVSPLEQNLYDKALRLRARGIDEEAVARATAYRRAFWSYLVTGEGLDEARARHAEIATEPWFTRDDFPVPFLPREELLASERMRHFAVHNGYEPRLTLERVRVPTLVILGEADRVVPVEASVAAFRSAFAASGHADELTVKLFPDAGHDLRVPAADGARERAPGYLDFMVDWVARRAFEGGGTEPGQDPPPISTPEASVPARLGAE